MVFLNDPPAGEDNSKKPQGSIQLMELTMKEGARRRKPILKKLLKCAGRLGKAHNK